MDQTAAPTPPDGPHLLRSWGLWAVLTGGVALALVFLGMIGPSMTPAPSAAAQVGEIAGEIKRAAWLSFFGVKPDPVAPEPETQVWMILALVGPVLGIVAIVLSVISGVLREHRRLAVAGAGLGAAAVLFQFFWLLALLICGVLLLISIVQNIGEIFSF